MNDRVLEKCRTGIEGVDDITSGGLPKGRPTLVAGTAGCGKTLFPLEFLIRGATQEELNRLLKQEKRRLNTLEQSRQELARQRHADDARAANGNGHQHEKAKG
jgi:KaiC/GvpD/RAD55 family RecA-like ATPase